MVDWPAKYSSYAQSASPSPIFSLMSMPRAADTINLGPGEPDPSYFPAKEIAETLESILLDPIAAKVALQYTVNAGLPELREKLAARHASKGLRCTADNVLITSGSQQGLDLLVSAFVEPGQTVAVQTPTYPGALGIFKAHGARLCSLDEAQAQNSQGPALIYTTPTFANPGGTTFSMEERHAIIQTARRVGAILVEDDPYETMIFGSPPPATILEIDAGQTNIEEAHTVYASTFSKSLVPGLRVGWLVGPKALIAKLTLLKQSEDMQAGTLSQVCASRMMDFVFRTHVPRLREVYRDRRDAMLAALDKHFGSMATWTKPEGGFFVWLTLPEHVDAMKLLPVAALNGVTFVPGAGCSHDGGFTNSLRLSYSTNPPEVLTEAVRRLSDSVRSLL